LNGQYSPNCVPASSPSGTQIPEALAFSNSELSRKEALREYHRQYRQKNKEALADRQHRYYLLHKETIKQGQRERRAQTKEATRERNKQYYLENKEARKEFQKKYRAQNKETLQRRKKEYYQTHKTAIALFQHVYRTKNKDSAKVKQKKYRTENKEAIRKIQQRYRKENEVLREYQRRYRREKREAIRELHKRYHAKHRLLNPRIRYDHPFLLLLSHSPFHFSVLHPPIVPLPFLLFFLTSFVPPGPLFNSHQEKLAKSRKCPKFFRVCCSSFRSDLY
jgi:hypothetical protein